MLAKKTRRFRGQAQIIGALLVFSIGIVILTGFTFLFNSMKDNIEGEFRQKSAEEVLNYVVLAAARLEGLHADYASATFPIPARIGDTSYVISADGGRALMLSTTEFSINVTSPVDISGMVDSNSEKAMLIYKGNTITIRGVG